VGFATAIQVRSPAHLQGRVYSAADTMVGIPQSISIAMGAALSTVVDYRVLVIVMAVVTAIAGVYLVSRRIARPDPVLAPPDYESVSGSTVIR